MRWRWRWPKRLGGSSTMPNSSLDQQVVRLREAKRAVEQSSNLQRQVFAAASQVDRATRSISRITEERDSFAELILHAFRTD